LQLRHAATKKRLEGCEGGGEGEAVVVVVVVAVVNVLALGR
jgi:hypothetical protein